MHSDSIDVALIRSAIAIDIVSFAMLGRLAVCYPSKQKIDQNWGMHNKRSGKMCMAGLATVDMIRKGGLHENTAGGVQQQQHHDHDMYRLTLTSMYTNPRARSPATPWPSPC